MRKSLVAGVVLAVAAVLVVLLSTTFDLDLESVSLLGMAVGAVIALVPDRTAVVRLAGFLGGLIAALIGYLLRAAILPDTTGGRAVAVGVVVLLCVALTAASLDRLPLWTTLLGAAAVAGAYEFTYAAAPTEIGATAVSAATTLLFTVAVGFLAVALIAPAEGRTTKARRPRPVEPQDPDANLDDLMKEKTK